jgi:hypothetical protein
MSKYHKDVTHLKKMDPYRLQELYQMHPCAEHVVKKMLVAGERSGGKSLDEDIQDCIDTLQRWQEMRAEDAALKFTVVDATCEAGPERFSTCRYDWSMVDRRFFWVARGGNGVLFAFSHEPTRDAFEWKPVTGVWGTLSGAVAIGSPCAEWSDSLEARPV